MQGSLHQALGYRKSDTRVHIPDTWYRRNWSKLPNPDAEWCWIYFKIISFERIPSEEHSLHFKRKFKEETYKKNTALKISKISIWNFYVLQILMDWETWSQDLGFVSSVARIRGSSTWGSWILLAGYCSTTSRIHHFNLQGSEFQSLGCGDSTPR